MGNQPEIPFDKNKRLKDDDTFQFSCHPGLECFTGCCYDLTLVLTPYDIFRLKKHLGMSSDEFLKKYTTTHVGPESGLPVVQLKMEGNYQKCPFLDQEKGCQVYEDRPGACRTYPLARMAVRSKDKDEVEEFYMIIQDPDCLGFKEKKTWSVKEWKEHEGLELYNQMNDLFGELLQARQQSGISYLNADQIELFYLACYNLDEFKKFFLEGPNLDRYMEPEEIIEKISNDDLELFKFALNWAKKKIFSGSCSFCALKGKCPSK